MSGPAGSSTWFGLDEYLITHSCRFEDGSFHSEPSHMHRTPTADGNLDKFTFSAWVKITEVRGGTMPLFAAGTNDSQYSRITLISSNRLNFTILDSDGNFAAAYKSTAVFKDFGAWYHFVVAVDTGQSTNTNRVKLYANGELLALEGGGDLIHPNQNYDTHFNDATYKNWLGKEPSGDGAFSGYMAEVNFVDGAQLAPTVFGESDDTYNHWKPIEYTGTYGTNGFYLDFKDASNLGNSQDGLLTDFTEVILAATDQMIDTPTNNFCTLNPNDRHAENSNVLALEGNLRIDFNSDSGASSIGSTMAPSSGKWYYEFLLSTADASPMFGFSLANANVKDERNFSVQGNYHYNPNGRIYGNETYDQETTWGNGDVMAVALDIDNGEIHFAKNNTWQNSGDPATRANPVFTGLGSRATASVGDPTTRYVPSFGSGGSAWDGVVNFGQDSSFGGNKTGQNKGGGGNDFYYEPPNGFYSLSTKNLSPPVVIPDKNFNVLSYTGNGGNSAENVVTGLSFKPDLVCIKDNAASNSTWVDGLRGSARYFGTNLPDAEGNRSTRVKRFNGAVDGGFALGNSNGTNGQDANVDGRTYTAWCWNFGLAGSAGPGTGGGTTVTLDTGGIASDVRVNVLAGQGVATYTGIDTPGDAIKICASGDFATFGVPHMYMVKNRGVADNWYVYHRGTGNTKHFHLNTTDNASTSPQAWANYGPLTGRIFIHAAGDTNVAPENYAAYSWSSKDGYSEMGAYFGNGSNDGTFVYTGFQPRFILIKANGGTEHWRAFDTVRNPINQATLQAIWSNNSAQSDETGLDILSNGFKLRDDDAHQNGDDVQYIYMAFAEVPFKYSNGH